MKPLNIFALSGSVLAISALISANQACAQRERDFELHTQTMFDWYIATPQDRMGTAFNIVTQAIPNSKQDFPKLVRAAEAFVECIDRQLRGPDSEPVAKFVEVCMALIGARGLFE